MTSLKYQYDDLMNPLLQAIRSLGGSGTNEEINNKVAEVAKIPADELDILHNPEKGGMTEIEYRLMWTRTYLKIYGIIDNSTRGVWSLTEKGSATDKVDQREVVHMVREEMRRRRQNIGEVDEQPSDTLQWQDALLDIILRMSPSAFERLIQRVLRESGFTQVEVTGRSGDGGIDGQGILRLGGFLGFRVLFQAKRWQGSVGPSIVRDFRGAMVGRADKGLLITTGSFTKEAVKESTRDGAPAIDLIDGDQLLEKLKQLSLGVTTKNIQVEQIEVDANWFTAL